MVVLLGASFRSRAYAMFRAVTLGLHTLIALPLVPTELPARILFLVLHALVYWESLLLIRPRMRPPWVRIVSSWPALTFTAATLLAWPWAVLASLGHDPWVWGAGLPYLLGMVGFVQSMSAKNEVRHVLVGGETGPTQVARWDEANAQALAGLGDRAAGLASFRIVQITDPHLGPWMSVQRLRGFCRRAVEAEPDLIVLTGDFLTMESQTNPDDLCAALQPLAEARCPVLACFGNHDHEAPSIVRSALSACGARLLVDDMLHIASPAGPVQVVGFDFAFRDRAARMKALVERFPREAGQLRLGLLHDPGAFRHLAPGEFDLVLSGHTHGGQVGFVSLGGTWTVAGAVAKIPDHGLWAHGESRLYVHRGTGHYGFPLRLGVPAEESVLKVLVQRTGVSPSLPEGQGG